MSEEKKTRKSRKTAGSGTDKPLKQVTARPPVEQPQPQPITLGEDIVASVTAALERYHTWHPSRYTPREQAVEVVRIVEHHLRAKQSRTAPAFVQNVEER